MFLYEDSSVRDVGQTRGRIERVGVTLVSSLPTRGSFVPPTVLPRIARRAPTFY
jgi:hypothetical protein